jgi:ribosomal protein L25 (general stress protein Ctc)
VTLPVPGERDPAALDAVARVLELLYVAAGTSYYKVAAPPRVELDTVRMTGPALAWARALYRQGLGEFAYRNDLPHVLDVEIRSGPGTEAPVVPRSMDGRAPVVCVGGGKDSIVSIEVLRTAGFRPAVFAVNPNPIIRAVMEVSEQPVLAARRKLDPRLFELNAEGAYNGHIPVTAINSLIAVATAVLGGYGPVVMSNERSASVPNLSWRGHDINHQWSKGLEAESLLRDALAAHAGLTNAYFSLLRGMSELHIASLFARIEAYDAVVTSCNVAFRLTDASARWCGDCDKCRFVFLALAPFTERKRLVGIFAKDMLTDTSQLPGYRELCGLAAHKPFECVGETDECLVALALLAGNPEWTDAAVVRLLAADVPATAWPSAGVRADVLRGDAPNHVPPAYALALAAADDPALDDPALDDPALEDPALDDPALDDPALDEAVTDEALVGGAEPDGLVRD